MIENESILCFAPDPWEAIWRNRHHIMTILAERNRVMYVEPRTYLRETWTMLKAGRLRWADWRGERVTQVRPNLYVYHNVPYAPISGRFPLKQLTAWVRRHSLKREMRRLGFARPILWLCRPEMGDLIGQFDEKLVVYHVVDEYSAYQGVSDAEAVRERERQLLARADLVLTTAPALWESKRAFNPNTHLVPNAVNYEAFAKVVESNDPPPADLADLPRPIAGYVGAINAKLDLTLFIELARRLPRWTVVLVGPVELAEGDSRLQTLRNMPNVHFLGKKSVDAVPHYIKGLDVCLLPYERNEWTRHISSLKLYEYLACGKPIVSTDVPAAREQGELVAIAQDVEQFVSLVQEALCQNSEDIVRRRRQVASQNTWRQRVERISALIEATLQAKGASCSCRA